MSRNHNKSTLVQLSSFFLLVITFPFDGKSQPQELSILKLKTSPEMPLFILMVRWMKGEMNLMTVGVLSANQNLEMQSILPPTILPGYPWSSFTMNFNQSNKSFFCLG